MLGKLRTIELIEADIQVLMRIIVNQRNEGNIESDPRISKSNYRLRLKYSIEDAILEKRLVYDNSLLSRKYIIYNMTDLESCYNR